MLVVDWLIRTVFDILNSLVSTDICVDTGRLKKKIHGIHGLHWEHFMHIGYSQLLRMNVCILLALEKREWVRLVQYSHSVSAAASPICVCVIDSTQEQENRSSSSSKHLLIAHKLSE